MFSGFENGNVVVLCVDSNDSSAASCKETICNLGEPLRRTYLFNNSTFLTSCSFLAGTNSGRLMLHTVRYPSSSSSMTSSSSSWYSSSGSSGSSNSPHSSLSEGKTTMLFSGANSPVCQISCYYKGSTHSRSTAQWEDDNIVAWADLCTVRIMDISTQTAICYLNAPLGVGVGVSLGDGSTNVLCPCPCSLFWCKTIIISHCIVLYQ